MAVDLLNLGSQSTLVAHKQLTTTGHNIANANTEGFSRQSVIQGTNNPHQFGRANYGMGVHVDNVRRSWDLFAVKELNLTTTNYARQLSDQDNLNLLSTTLSSSASQKIPTSINNWFDSLKNLADSPNSLGARKVVLEESKTFVNDIKNFHEIIRRQGSEVNSQLAMEVDNINRLAFELRDLQLSMMKKIGPQNDLMDQHERLIRELAQYTKVTVTPRANNQEGFNIMIGNGHTLVTGSHASQLKMIDGYPDPEQHRLAIIEGKGIKTINAYEMDGKIASLFAMRDQHVPKILDEIGVIACAYSDGINQLQAQGLDLNGDVGANLFTDINEEAIAKSRVIAKPTSNADVAVFIYDLRSLKGGEYTVRYDGDFYHVTTPDGKQMQFEVSNSKPFFELNGMKVNIRNDLEIGEKILLRPTRDSASLIELETQDSDKIAGQSYEASTTFAQGSADFTIMQVGDVKEFVITVEAPDETHQTQWLKITDKDGNLISDSYAYPLAVDQSIAISVPAGHPLYQNGKATVVNLSEGAFLNDKFTANLVPSEGSNGNLIKMQKLQTAKFLNDNESTLIDVYHNLNTQFGLKSSSANRLLDVAFLEKTAAQERIATISGVNLDEEAANMMRFQQAYMASSRVIQAANDTFNTILQLR